MISEIVTPVRRSLRLAVRHTVARIVLWVAAGVAAGVATGFFTAAAYLRLERDWGAPAATLILAVVFLAFAALLALSATRIGTGAPVEPPLGDRIRAGLSGALAAGAIPALLRRRRKGDGAVGTDDSGAGASASGLGVAEKGVAEKGLAAAERGLRRLGPLPRVGAGLLAGYLVGRAVDRRLDGRADRRADR